MSNKEKKGTLSGLLGGILWALDTVLMGIFLIKSSFPEYLFIVPLVTTFFHDFFSSIWLLIYNILKGNKKKMLESLKNKNSIIVIISALFGGPIGMTGYVLAIKYIGPSYTAIISAAYPAIGSFFAFIFLKEKLKFKGIIGLTMAIIATMILGFTSSGTPQNLIIGFICAFLCVLGWGCESVITSYGMKQDIIPDIALQIRQVTSTIVYVLLILPLFGDLNFIIGFVQSKYIWLLILTSLFGTASYLFYYRSIDKIGPIKAMGLNISYSAWAIFIGVLFGNKPTLTMICLSIIIIVGSILTTENPKEFFQLFKIKKGSG